MKPEAEIGDGLLAFNREIDAKEVARIVGTLARWVDPETFHLLPVWHPELARKQSLYKAGWASPQTNQGKPKFEGNTKANAALSRALGVAKKSRPDWTCCHIWGNDDTSFSKGISEVNDPRYYSCIANMVLLPTPLKAFTDAVPQMKAALRLAAFHLYGLLPEGKALPTVEDAGDWLPEGWGHGDVTGIRWLNAKIERSAQKRGSTILREIRDSTGKYPTNQVERVLRYWSSKIPNSLLDGAS
ncbi:MAG: hypothetical protein COB08_009780 [Rhodobacteraceae bacterium]|nr:hypothetical protein [Paracoccaceae bacterium]